MEKSREMAKLAYEALDERKGEDIKIIRISEISVLADYFIIANGKNGNQVSALADGVEDKLSEAGYPLKQKEGHGSTAWLLLDFGEVIVHVFDRENRLFYDLEQIWSKGKFIEAEEL